MEISFDFIKENCKNIGDVQKLHNEIEQEAKRKETEMWISKLARGELK